MASQKCLNLTLIFFLLLPVSSYDYRLQIEVMAIQYFIELNIIISGN